LPNVSRQEIIGISAIDLIWGFGTLHCLTNKFQNKYEIREEKTPTIVGVFL
jgi:hypothetical protein